MQRPDVSGRLVLWALELTQYDISFKPRAVIKGQALADFMAKFSWSLNSYPEDEPAALLGTNVPILGEEWPSQSKVWTLLVDGASNQHGCMVGIVLIDPEGVESTHCLTFEFRAINNEVEYEALLAGLNAAKELEA